MRNTNFDSSLERMKELINCGSNDASLKPNVSETVESKVIAADGKTYGIVRECQRYFIKEQASDGSFGYIGGIGNKTDNEYPSYNSASRNLELKIRSINEAKNNGLVHEQFKPAEQAEYIVEATEDMRKELDRFRQITNGAQNIMKESSTEFINKPKFKDPEGFGTVSDPKKQGGPFEEEPEGFKGDIDPKSSSKTPKNAGDPFEKEVKAAPEKMDIETTTKAPCEAGKFGGPAENVPAGSVANQKPKGGKVVKVTEAQMKQAQKIISEGYFDDDDDLYGDQYANDDLLGKFDYPEINKLGRSAKPIPATRADVDLDLPDESEPEETYDQPELDDEIEEGFMDNLKAAGSVGKMFGNKAANTVKQGAQNIAGAVGNKVNAAKQGIQNVGQQASQKWNQSLAQSSAASVQKVANQLKATLDKMNAQTVKGGGQPLNYKSILSTLSNQISNGGNANMSRFQSESVDENLVNEITEAVLSAFGKHPSYQKPAFTTPASNQSLIPGTKEWDDESVKGETAYGTKIGSSAPFDQPVKQKVGEGEIGTDGDEVIKGKAQQGKPNLGKDGDKAPFTKPVEKGGDKIAKGTPVQKGETQQGKPELGKKGETKPFEKKVTNEAKKEEILNRLAESIIRDLKKK